MYQSFLSHFHHILLYSQVIASARQGSFLDLYILAGIAPTLPRLFCREATEIFFRYISRQEPRLFNVKEIKQDPSLANHDFFVLVAFLGIGNLAEKSPETKGDIVRLGKKTLETFLKWAVHLCENHVLNFQEISQTISNLPISPDLFGKQKSILHISMVLRSFYLFKIFSWSSASFTSVILPLVEKLWLHEELNSADCYGTKAFCSIALQREENVPNTRNFSKVLDILLAETSGDAQFIADLIVTRYKRSLQGIPETNTTVGLHTCFMFSFVSPLCTQANLEEAFAKTSLTSMTVISLRRLCQKQLITDQSELQTAMNLFTIISMSMKLFSDLSSIIEALQHGLLSSVLTVAASLVVRDCDNSDIGSVEQCLDMITDHLVHRSVIELVRKNILSSQFSSSFLETSAKKWAPAFSRTYRRFEETLLERAVCLQLWSKRMFVLELCANVRPFYSVQAHTTNSCLERLRQP